MRILHVLLLVACGSKTEPTKPPDPPPGDAAASIWDRPLVDADPNAPKRLEHPKHIDDCNIDFDCRAMSTCDCERCVTHNGQWHVEPCPKVCDTNPCSGKKPVCRDHRCTFE